MKIHLIPAALAILLHISLPSIAQDRFPVQCIATSWAQEGFPCWSPDGKTILYERIQRRDSLHLTGLWTVSPEGGEPRQLTDYIGEHPEWSPDGAWIVFDADSGNSIKVVSSSGGEPTRIVPEHIHIFRGGKPIWSPDGSRIAFREESNLRVLEVKSGESTIVLGKAGMFPLPCYWSRDNKEIYICLREMQSPKSTLEIVSLERGAHRQFLGDTAVVYRTLDVSPDGTLIAYVSCKGRNCDLWLTPAKGGKSIQLTTYPGYDDSPRWSPDGTRLLFASTRAGTGDIYLMTLDIAEIRRELGMGSSR